MNTDITLTLVIGAVTAIYFIVRGVERVAKLRAEERLLKAGFVQIVVPCQMQVSDSDEKVITISQVVWRHATLPDVGIPATE